MLAALFNSVRHTIWTFVVVATFVVAHSYRSCFLQQMTPPSFEPNAPPIAMPDLGQEQALLSTPGMSAVERFTDISAYSARSAVSATMPPPQSSGGDLLARAGPVVIGGGCRQRDRGRAGPAQASTTAAVR